MAITLLINCWVDGFYLFEAGVKDPRNYPLDGYA